MPVEPTLCPECGSRMVSRKNKSGERFWGCSTFPKCRGTRNTDGEAPRRRPPSDEDTEHHEYQLPSSRWSGNDRRRWDR